MSQWGNETHDEQQIRGILGRLLFGKDAIDKPVRVCSGGEKGRLLFGKLMLQSPNVMILDEPTNHMDMESIESLNLAMDLYPGTVVFVSHDRGVRQLAGQPRHRAQADGLRRLQGQLRGLPAEPGHRLSRVPAGRSRYQQSSDAGTV